MTKVVSAVEVSPDYCMSCFPLSPPLSLSFSFHMQSCRGYYSCCPFVLDTMSSAVFPVIRLALPSVSLSCSYLNRRDFLAYVTEKPPRENNGNDERAENLASQSNEQSEQCCGSNGICSHEVLRDGESDSASKVVPNKFTRKVTLPSPSPSVQLISCVFCIL